MSTTFISLAALFVSGLSLFLTFRNNRRFASNQFINKQIDVIAELLKILHGDIFRIDFVPELAENSRYSRHVMTTIFDVLVVQQKGGQEILSNLGNTPIYFDSSCNQLLQIREFIDNPYLPKSIADNLLNFYSSRLMDIPIFDLNGDQVIIVTTDHFEPGSITGDEKRLGVLKRSNAKGLVNWTEFMINIRTLENSIEQYLKKYNVDEINIRRDLKHIYVT